MVVSCLSNLIESGMSFIFILHTFYQNMVSKLQIQQLILGTSCALSVLSYFVYEIYKQGRPAPDIPIQSWDKYVSQQKSSGRDL